MERIASELESQTSDAVQLYLRRSNERMSKKGGQWSVSIVTTYKGMVEHS